MFTYYVLKYKWYLLGLIFIIAIFLFFIFDFDEKYYQELNEWLFNKKTELVKEAAEQRKNSVKKYEDDNSSLQEQSKDLDKKLEELKEQRLNRDKHLDKMTLKELDNVWKDLGY